MSYDDRLFHLLFAREHRGLAAAAIAFSAAGSGWALLGLVPFAAVKRTRRFAVWLFATLTGTAAVVAIAKDTIGRGRPCTAYATVRAIVTDSPTDCSFPSGHAAGSFAFALFMAQVLLHERRSPTWRSHLGVAGCCAFASCVAVSRVVLGFHFPGDVLAGAALGGTIGAAAGRAYMRHART